MCGGGVQACLSCLCMHSCLCDMLGFKGSSKSNLSVTLTSVWSRKLRMSIWCNTSGSAISCHVTERWELNSRFQTVCCWSTVRMCVGSAVRVADLLARRISFMDRFYEIVKWIFVFIKLVVIRPLGVCAQHILRKLLGMSNTWSWMLELGAHLGRCAAWSDLDNWWKCEWM